MTDEKLIALIKKKPEKGLSVAIELYGGAVRTICRSVLENREDVEEAVSQVFYRLWKYSGSYNGKGSLKSYIYSIARNAAFDAAKAAPVEYEWDNIDTETPETLFIKRQREQLIHQIVDELPEPDRSIFILKYFYFFKNREIAQKLNLSLKQVENKLARNKEKLRAKLIERGI